ncbi:hypothetical protein HPB51_024425 [Rhipicephalus microplus]|uniref:BEN domain-containing protein n=1 Tax=Rhipicephalus microplus TaxID=6941 RepID=A0A9J6E3Z5_RHIMP|nr:hypothetical protein HPB51_024425 [Rhipicephalus microplus]
MSHILVKWVSSSLWDVYNVRAIVDTSVSLQLLMDANAIVNLRGTVVAVNWKEGEPAADAELLDFGLERTMERRRTRLVRLASTASDSAEEVPREENAPNEQVKELENEVRELRKRLEVAENLLVHIVAKTQFFINFSFMELPEEMQEVPNLASSNVVNIGGGVLVEKTLLERLHSHCNGPTKFARRLLRGVFTLKEMRGKSLFGKGSNANKNAEVKEALDPVRVNAVKGHGKNSCDGAGGLLKHQATLYNLRAASSAVIMSASQMVAQMSTKLKNVKLLCANADELETFRQFMKSY